MVSPLRWMPLARTSCIAANCLCPVWVLEPGLESELFEKLHHKQSVLLQSTILCLLFTGSETSSSDVCFMVEARAATGV